MWAGDGEESLNVVRDGFKIEDIIRRMIFYISNSLDKLAQHVHAAVIFESYATAFLTRDRAYYCRRRITGNNMSSCRVIDNHSIQLGSFHRKRVGERNDSLKHPRTAYFVLPRHWAEVYCLNRKISKIRVTAPPREAKSQSHFLWQRHPPLRGLRIWQ